MSNAYFPRLFKLLGLSACLPKDALGKYSPISFANVRIPDGPNCQVYYPADPSSLPKKPKHPVYLDADNVDAISSLLKSKVVVSGLKNAHHHLLPCMELHPEFHKRKCPVIFFSHGLYGNGSVYSVLCKDLASLGFVVVAVEHEDGSACFVRDAHGNPIHYTDLPPFDQTSKLDMIQFRRPFLDHRRQELHTTFTYFRSTCLGNTRPAEGSPVWLHENLDMGSVVLAGHSFGAASMVDFSHQLHRQFGDAKLPLCAAILFDLWSHPLDQQTLERGVPVPVLSVLSEEFTMYEFFLVDTFRLLRASRTAVSVKIPHSMHVMFSDVPWWMPHWIMNRRYAQACEGAKLTPRETIRQDNITTVRNFLRKHTDKRASLGSVFLDDPSLQSPRSFTVKGTHVMKPLSLRVDMSASEL